MKLVDIVMFNPKETIKKGSDVPFIDMAALPINNKFVDKIASKPYRGGGAKFRNGDTLFARITPCLENGKGAIVSGLVDDEVACGSTEFIVLRAQMKSDEAFAYYVTREPAFRQFAEKRMFGTSGRQRVPWQALTDFELNDFSTDERRLIGDLLSSLDNKIEINRQMNEVLEGMAQAVFKDWFVDFGPVRRKQNGEKDPVKILGGLIKDKQKAKKTAALFPDTFGDNDLPLGWEEGVLGDLACDVRSKVDPSKVPSTTPYIGLEHMPRGSIALASWDYAPKVTSTKAAFLKGQTLFGKLRPYFHKVGIAPVDGICSTDIVVCDSKRKEDREWLTACASSKIFVEYTNKASTGTRMPRTSWKVMREYEVAISPIDVRDAYHSLVAVMFDKILQSISENQTLAETRDYLLPKLMSGEIRVGDVEVAVQSDNSNVIPFNTDLLGRKTLPADKSVERDAVMVAAIIRAFDGDGYVVGNFRYQKAMYFMRRRLAHSLATTTKKAAGPYDGALRYTGGHALAIQRKYIREAFINGRTGNKPASKISEIDSLITQYDLQDALTWIMQKFKFKSSDEFECLATVDFAMNELRSRGAAINVIAIQNGIASDPEWKPKLTKPHFTAPKIRSAIAELETLFGEETL